MHACMQVYAVIMSFERAEGAGLVAMEWYGVPLWLLAGPTNVNSSKLFVSEGEGDTQGEK